MENDDHWIDYGRATTGTEVVDPPTLDAILNTDREPRPALFRERGDYWPEPRLITYDRYTDPKFVEREVQNIWDKYWQFTCREEDIPNIGDRISYDIVNKSFVVVRTGPKEFRAFHNSCRHRGRKLCDNKGSGSEMRCNFHGWTYGLDGKLKWIPLGQDFPHINAGNASLKEIKCATWGGHVFVNPDSDAGPLEDALGILIDHFKDFPLEERYTAERVLIKIRCNWKAAQEAFIEGYHVVETHFDGMPMFGSVGSQIDAWTKGKGLVSRLAVPGATTDSYIADRVSPREGLVLFCSAYELEAPPEDRGHTPLDARRYAAEAQRTKLERETGRDLAGKNTCYFVDMVKYLMFPSFHPWWGEGLPWWYNFRPLGDNPDTCLMEYRTLLPIPANGERPPVPEPVILEFGERAAHHPELGATGHILDQDLNNMEAVQLGFKAAAKGEAYLNTGMQHEAAIRHFHEIYDRLLGLDSD